MTKDILALDLATKTGWAHSCGESGVQDFSLKRGDSPGMRFIRFRAWLTLMLETLPVAVIVYEQAHHRGGAATHVCENLIGRVMEIAAASSTPIETAAYHTATIKKHATGKGNAPKSVMLELARQKWGEEVIDDNHADALWLLDLATHELGATDSPQER